MPDLTTPDSEDTLTAASLQDRFETDIEDGGAVYKAPETTDRFLHYSWIAVLPTGKVALSRWIPTPEEDINLARERSEEVPTHTGLHMWDLSTPTEAAEHLSDEDLTALERIGTITMIERDGFDDKPHLDLDNPEAETDRPEAFEQ